MIDKYNTLLMSSAFCPMLSVHPINQKEAVVATTLRDVGGVKTFTTPSPRIGGSLESQVSRDLIKWVNLLILTLHHNIIM